MLEFTTRKISFNIHDIAVTVYNAVLNGNFNYNHKGMKETSRKYFYLQNNTTSTQKHIQIDIFTVN
jgi:hypothetical protein